ncbi:uncharacterized protein LOC142983391 [Anticarsia gemmatalis]|uniref:uncharacterized protein LOC142983391 n=1 Tax=Anticarsia gemmatalis TaxID=129554 RepID=UPI003F76009E
MMKSCAACNNQFNDGVQCGVCKRHLDFGCAGISEAGWRKLGADRRIQWKCAGCRASSPAVQVPEQVTLDTVLKEIRDMKRQLLTLPTLAEDMRTIKDELTELKASCEYSCGKLDELGSRVSDVESRVLVLEKLQDQVNCLQTDLQRTKNELSTYEQRSRLNNVEIKGVPVKQGENLFTIMEKINHKINYNLPKSQINYIYRVPMYNSKEKLIIVSFLNRYIKEDFIAAARAVKDLSTADLGFAGSFHKVYVNDHLSADHKKLLSKVKQVSKDKNYQFVWIKHGKIHILKDTNSKVLIIRSELDLNKIV